MIGPGLNAPAAPFGDDFEGGFTSEESTRVVMMSRAKDLTEIRVSMHRKREERHVHIVPFQYSLRPLLIFKHHHEVVEERFVHKFTVLVAPLSLGIQTEASLSKEYQQRLLHRKKGGHQNSNVANSLRFRFSEIKCLRDQFLARHP